MIVRVLLAWLLFSGALLTLALLTQGSQFELQHAGWSLLLSTPIIISLVQGGIGDAVSKDIKYPSVALLILSIWIISAGPSLVVESEAARYLYYYSDESLTLARVFFLGWCSLFALAAGKALPGGIRVRPDAADFIALALCSVLLVTYLMTQGVFSAYQASHLRGSETGSSAAAAVAVGFPFLGQLPPLLFAFLLRSQIRGTLYSALFAAFASSWVVLFLLASRTSLVVAFAACLVIARHEGLRFRTNAVVGLGVLIPAVLLLVMVYRNALASSEDGAANVSQYITIASEATTSLDNEEAQINALDMAQENMRVRLWYGQVFCIVIDEWLAEGAALRGSLFAGIVGTLPTAIWSEKNEVSNAMSFERLLRATHRFPEIDLPPTPWMQWLFELGILGLVVGALFYGWLARTLESRIAKTGSVYELLLWLQLFSSVTPPEHTTDFLALSARSALLLVLMISGLAQLVRWVGQRLRNARVPA